MLIARDAYARDLQASRWLARSESVCSELRFPNDVDLRFFPKGAR